MRNLIIILVFLVSGFAMAQSTTVVLEDQCNCEVLSGTAITASGATSPVGADLGDIYVNTDTGTIYYWDGGSWELTSSDSQQLQNFSFNTGTNLLTLTLENGGSVSVDLSALNVIGTDNQALTLETGNILTLEDGGTVDLAPFLDNTDDQQVTDFSLDGTTNELTLTLEDGGTQTVDFSAVLAAADNQALTLETGNILTLEDGGTVDLAPFLDNTDNQQVTDFSLDGTTNELTLTLEDGGTQTVDFSAVLAAADNQALTLETGNILTLEDGGTVDLAPFLDNTDDQQVTDFSLDGTTNELTLTLEDGGTQTVDFSAVLAAADNQALTLETGNILTLEDGGTVDLSPFLDNTDDQQVTDFSLDGTTNELTLTLEDGGTQTVDFSAVLAAADNQALTLETGNILTLEDGGTVDLAPFLDNTDDQQVTDFSLDGTTNELTLTLEDGGTQTVDFSAVLAAADNQALTLETGNILTLEDGGTVDLTPFLDNTDDQQVTDFSLDGTTNELTLTLEDGGTQTVDFSAVLAAADNQALTLETGNILTLEDGGTVDLTPFLDNTDDQNIENLDLTGNTLTVGIENGAAQTVDLSALVGTDNQNIENLALAGNTLTVGIEDGTSQNVDLSSLVGTDDQTITAFSLDNTTNILTISLEDGNSQTVDLSVLNNIGSDDQNISGSVLTGTNLTIGIENGTNEIVDLSSLANTDEQDLNSAVVIANESVELQITNGNNTTIDIRDADADVTNELAITGAGTPTATGTIGSNNGETYVDTTTGQLYVFEGGTWQQVGGSASPDADPDPTNEINTAFNVTGGNLNITDSGGTLSVPLSSIDTDNQDLTLSGTDLSIEDGNTVDLSGFVSTDDQNISGSVLSGTDLTIGIENGTNEVIDLSSLVGTDDQNLTLVGNILSLEDGGTVDLTTYLDNTDDQTITAFSLDNTTNVLTITLEDGNTQTVDLSVFNNAGTDDQNLTLTGNSLEIEDGNNVDLSGYLDNTDDQNIENLGLSGNVLTVGIENGTSQTVDLSTLVGTDNQNIENLALVGNTLTVGIEDGTSQNVDLSSLIGTDDQTITAFSLDNITNILTITLEDGNTQNVDLSVLDNIGTDDQNISGSTLTGTDLTIGIENGTNEVVDLSSLVGTDDQGLNLVGNTLTLEDGGTVDLSAYLDDTDNQTITNFDLGAGNILTITLEDGNTQTVDLSGLNDAGTDDQNLSTDGTAGNISIEDGNSISLNVDDADSDPGNEYNTAIGTNTGNLEITDNGSTLSTALISADANNDLSPGTDGALYLNVSSVTISETITDLTDTNDGSVTYVNESGATQKVAKADITDNGDGTYTFTNNDGTDVLLDTRAASSPYSNSVSGLSATDTQAAIDELSAGSTDDQNLTLSGTDLSIEDGNTVDLSGFVSTDDQNLTLVGNTLTLEDGGTVDLTAYLDDTDDQTVTAFAIDNVSNVLTITLENGNTRTVDLSGLDDAGTDDQNIESLGLAGNILTVGIENGTAQTVDLSALDNTGTDDQQLALATNTLTLEDGGTVDLSGYLDNTDDQNIESLGLAGNILTVGIENGTAQTVDLSSLDNAGTDDQNLTGAALSASNILQIDIENGSSTTVDLSALDNTGTDDQQLTLAANTLTLEDGGTVDLSGYLDNTDEQNLTLSGTDLSIDDGNTVDLSGFVSTDDQNISGSGLTGTDLTIGIENGTNEVVDLSSLVGTDDQNLTLVGNTLTLEDGGTVDLTAYLDDTDDQTVTAFAIDNVSNVLTITLENGNTRTVDLSGLDDAGTDDQNIESLGLAGNILTVGIENGTAQTVDLSALDNAGTDDQQLALATNTLTLEDGGTVDLSGYLDNTDEQNLTLSGTDLSIDDGNTVDLSGFVSTDDQNISGSGLTGTDLTIGIENGASQVVDLSSLSNTDNQTIDNLSLNSGILNLSLEDDGVAAETIGLISTDANNNISAGTDGALYLNVSSVTISETNTALAFNGATNELTYTNELGNNPVVDLSILANTDDQNIENLGLTGNILTVGIENGTAQTVDLSALNNSGTDNQNLTGAVLNSSNILQIDIEDGTSTTVDLSVLDNAGTDDQQLTLAANTLTLEDGGTVDLSGYLDNTDDQNIESLGLAGNILTVGIENGTAQTVDLSSLDNAGTDDQNLTGAALSASNILQIDIENGSSTTVDLSALDNTGTDDQQLTLAANTLTLEDGGTVDLSGYLDNTDEQNLTLSGTDLSIDDGNTVDLSGFVSTDDQNISGSGLTGTDLTIGIENGTNEVVDLSSLVGTDDQNLTLVGNTLTLEDGGTVDLTAYLDDTDDQTVTAIESLGLAGNILTVGLENGTAQTVDLSALDNAGTDDQQLALATNTLTLEDGGTVDLSGYLDNTDDQNIESLGLAGNILTVGIENGTAQTVDLSSLDNAGTDDQNLTGAALSASNILQIDIENGSSTTVDLSALDNTGTDDQQLTLATNTLTLEDGGTVDLSGYLDNTDEQNLTCPERILASTMVIPWTFPGLFPPTTRTSAARVLRERI